MRVFGFQSDDSFGWFTVFGQMIRLSNFAVFSRIIYVCGGFTVFGRMICSVVFVRSNDLFCCLNRLICSVNLMSVGLYSYGGFILFSFGCFVRHVFVFSRMSVLVDFLSSV